MEECEVLSETAVRVPGTVGKEELEDQEPNDLLRVRAVAAGVNRPDIPNTVHGEDASQAIGQIPEWKSEGCDQIQNSEET